MRQTYPLISCICVIDNRIHLLKRAFACFETQNYPNKELVISYTDTDEEIKSEINSFAENTGLRILKIGRDAEETLVVSINRSIAKCTGDYVCLWDSENWYHPSRLSFQYLNIQDAGYHYEASILKRIILFDSAHQKAYASSPYIWIDSILCNKEVFLTNPFTDSVNGELKDESLIEFLQSKKSLYFIENSAFLYVRLYDEETSGSWNYEFLAQGNECLDENIIQSITSSLNINT